MIQKITLALVFAFGISANAQVKVYSDYSFENAKISVTQLQNTKGDQFLSTDEKGTLVLKNLPEANLQSQIDDLKQQLAGLRQLLTERQTAASSSASDFTFTLSPNPSCGIFDFNFTQVVPDKIVVYDSKGLLVKTVDVSSGNTRVDLQQSSKGSYIVSLLSGEKLLGTKKLIVE